MRPIVTALDAPGQILTGKAEKAGVQYLTMLAEAAEVETMAEAAGALVWLIRGALAKPLPAVLAVKASSSSATIVRNRQLYRIETKRRIKWQVQINSRTPV